MDVSPRLTAALRYASQGLKIFPCKPGKKEPCIKEPFDNASTDPAVIQGWFARFGDVNIAICPEDNGRLVVDLDNKNGKTGEANWHDLPGEKPWTTTITTPSSGVHLHYLGSCRPTAGELADGIDTRGIRSYVLLPPSVTDKGTYEWFDDMLPVPAPDWLIEWGKKIERTRKLPPEGFEFDQPWNVNLARGDLEELVRQGMVAAIGTRDDLTFKTAILMLERGLSQDVAADLMKEVWEPHGYPLDEGVIEEKLANAAHSMTNEPGCRAFPDPRADIPEGVVQNPPAPIPAHVKEGRRRFQGYSPEEHANLPPIEFWDNHRQKPILPRMAGGCAIVVYGAQGSHKTGVVLKELVDMALHKGARVLYVAAEGALGIGTARLPALMRERGRPLSDLTGLWVTCPDTPNVMDPNDVKLLLAEYAEFKPDFIVFDTGTRCLGMADINNTAIGTAAIVAMENVGRPSDATVLYITHPGKDTERGAIGSKQQENQAFGQFRIENDGNGTVTLTVDKLKDSHAHFSIPFRVVEGGVPVVVEMSAVEQARALRMAKPRHETLKTEVYEEVYGWLSSGAEITADNRGGGMGPGFFAGLLREKGYKIGDDDKVVAAALAGLVQDGRLVRDGKKNYRLSDPAIPPDSLQH